MIDITKYNDNELVLIVYNTEELYNDAKIELLYSGDCRNLIYRLSEEYIFTDIQKQNLINSF